MLLLLVVCSVRAERKEQSRLALKDGEQVIQYVDENQERPFCWLALQKGGEEPVVFWSREAGDVISWNAKPGPIVDADRKGDDVFVLFLAGGVRMYFIQSNLETKRERMTPIPREEFEEKFELMSNGRFKLEAPNKVHGFPQFEGVGPKDRLLEWREDGKPYLDGEPMYHLPSLPSPARYSGTTSPPSVSMPVSPLPDLQNVPGRGRAERPAATAWSEPSLWVAGLLLLAGAGVWVYTRKARR